MEVVSLNPRRMLIFPLVFLAASIAASGPLRGVECRANERILDFQGRVECLEDASITVEERITVLSEGQEIRHGIYRDILLRNWEGRPSRIEILGARLDGNPVALKGEVITQGKRIYLGDPDRELPPGIHLFSLSYRMSGQVANLRDRDEIYWNVTGNDWTFPIERASCLVLPPGGVNPGGNLHVAAYTGPRGSRGTDFRHEVSGKGILFTTTRPLEPGEGLTVAVGWPKGLVSFPPSSSRNTGWITFAAGMGLVLLYYLGAWFLSGRDAPKEIVTPLFEPPEKMTPAEARRIYRMALDMGAFPAELVDLAVKGVLRIEEREGDFFLSMDRQLDVSDLPGHQKALVKSLLAAALESSGRLESIKAAAGRRGLIGRLARKSLEMGKVPTTPAAPAGRIDLPLSRSNAAGLQSSWSALRKDLEARQASRSLFSRNTGKWALGLAGSILALAGMFYANDPKGFIEGGGLFLALWLSLWTIGVLLLSTATVMLWARLAKSPSLPGGLMALFFTLFTLPFVAAEIFGLYQLSLVTFTPILQQTIPALSFVVAAGALFKVLLKRYSAEGQSLRAKVEGYRLYLSMAEEGPLKALSSPSASPALFERHLPFAMALDVAEAWAGRFAGQLGAGYAPDWYRGGSFSGGDGFVQGFSGAFSGAVSSASSSSSGGSGGGGSSGGGGGGGGGGGW